MNLIGVPVGDPDPSYAPLNRDELAAMANVLKFTVLADRLAVKVPAWSCRGRAVHIVMECAPRAGQVEVRDLTG